MISSSPAEYYIKGLIVHPDKYDDATIVQICEEQSIEYLSVPYIERLRSRLVTPQPFYPKDKRHVPSQRFLLRERIQGLFDDNDQDTRLAQKIVATPRAKEFVEAMLLAHAPALQIARAVQQQTNLVCTPAILQKFEHFYWNVSLLDSTSMRALIDLSTRRAEASANPEVKLQGAALRRAGYQDPRRLAADLPYSPVTALMAQMRMGAMPTTLEISKIVEISRNIATVRTLEVMLQGGPKASMDAANYANVARTMTEMLENVVKPAENLREQLSAIALRTTERVVPSIHQLSGGSHTAELQPIEAKENEPDFSAPSNRRSRK